MALKLPKSISKMSVKDLLDLDWDTLKQMDTKQARSLEKRFRKVTEKRLDTIKRYGEYSGAADAFFGRSGIPALSKTKSSRNEIMHNVSVYKDFLEAKTSTLTGLRKVRTEAEKRIFGINERTGKPLQRFKNVGEEKRFWAAYEEYMNMHPEDRFSSSRIQQFLGEMTFWKEREFNMADLAALAERAVNAHFSGEIGNPWFGETLEEGEWDS